MKDKEKETYEKFDRHIVESFETQMNHFRNLLEQFYEFTPKEVEFPVKYEGQELTHSCIRAYSYGIEENLTEEALEYDEERGRDALQVLIGKIFQLGYQSGYVYKMKDQDLLFRMQEGIIEGLQDQIFLLKGEKNPKDMTEEERKDYDTKEKKRLQEIFANKKK